MTTAAHRLDWREQAACAGWDTNLWYEGTPADTKLAKKVCAVCPVKTDCLLFGLPERWGIFGGLDVRERRQITGTFKGHTR